MDDFDLDANLSARSEALAGSDDQLLRSIPVLLLLCQCLSSSQGLTDAIRQPQLQAAQVGGAFRAFDLPDAAEAYEEALRTGPPYAIHSDDVDIRQWPQKDRYLALRSEFERMSGEITRRVYALARHRWAEISVLRADERALRESMALRKRLRLR